MATKETRAVRGRTRGLAIHSKLIRELTAARRTAGLSQRSVAELLGWSQSEMSRFENLANPPRVSLVDVAQVASVLGLELGASLYLLDQPIRDKGHQALIGRFRSLLSASWRVAAEVPLPNLGDPRAWDLVLRIAVCIVGVEAETRVRDVQALVRRIHQRERDGGTDAIVIVLAESSHNRRLLAGLLEALGEAYATPPRAILNALRRGRPLPGSGVVLL